jgi:hypothetical protein
MRVRVHWTTWTEGMELQCAEVPETSWAGSSRDRSVEGICPIGSLIGLPSESIAMLTAGRMATLYFATLTLPDSLGT